MKFSLISLALASSVFAFPAPQTTSTTGGGATGTGTTSNSTSSSTAVGMGDPWGTAVQYANLTSINGTSANGTTPWGQIQSYNGTTWSFLSSQNSYSNQISELLQLIQMTSGASQLIQNQPNAVVFAPTNAALQTFSNNYPWAMSMLENDNSARSAILEYHIANITNTTFLQLVQTSGDNEYIAPTVAGWPVKLDANATISNVTVITAPNATSVVQNVTTTTNGGVILVDSVLYPLLNASTTLELLGTTTLVQALQELNATQQLNYLQNVTILAPSNQALSQLTTQFPNLTTAGTSSNFSSITNTTFWNQAMNLHIIPGVYTARDLAQAYIQNHNSSVYVPTALSGLNGTNNSTGNNGNSSVNYNNWIVAMFNTTSGIRFQGPLNTSYASVLSADNLFAGGVIHVVDGVLLPNNATSSPNSTSNGNSTSLVQLGITLTNSTYHIPTNVTQTGGFSGLENEVSSLSSSSGGQGGSQRGASNSASKRSVGVLAPVLGAAIVGILAAK